MFDYHNDGDGFVFIDGFVFACATSPEVGFEFGLISGLLFLCLGWCACGSQMGGVNGSRRRYAASGHAARLGALKRSRAVGYDPTKHANLKMLCSQKKSGWCRIAVVWATFLGAVATGVRGLLDRVRGLFFVEVAAGAIYVFIFRFYDIVGSYLLQVHRLGEKQAARSFFFSVRDTVELDAAAVIRIAHRVRLVVALAHQAIAISMSVSLRPIYKVGVF